MWGWTGEKEFWFFVTSTLFYQAWAAVGLRQGGRRKEISPRDWASYSPLLDWLELLVWTTVYVLHEDQWWLRDCALMRDLVYPLADAPQVACPQYGPPHTVSLLGQPLHGCQSHIFSEPILRINILQPCEDFLTSTLRQKPLLHLRALHWLHLHSVLFLYPSSTHGTSANLLLEIIHPGNKKSTKCLLFKRFTWVPLPHIRVLREKIDCTFTPPKAVFPSSNLPWEVRMGWVVQLVL